MFAGFWVVCVDAECEARDKSAYGPFGGGMDALTRAVEEVSAFEWGPRGQLHTIERSVATPMGHVHDWCVYFDVIAGPVIMPRWRREQPRRLHEGLANAP